MAYRTKTSIAADWDGDKAAVDKLHEYVKTAMVRISRLYSFRWSMRNTTNS